MSWLKRLAWLIGPKNTEAKVVLVGVKNSGKSTMMVQLKPREVKMCELSPNIPVGVTAEKFVFNTLTFVAFDLYKGHNGFGHPWEDHYRDCDGIIFVVDSADRMNIPLVQEHLEKLVTQPLVERRKDIPLLVLANKTDQPAAMSSLQLAQMLALDQLNRPCHIVCTDALTGEGLNEALDWLAHQLRTVCSHSSLAIASNCVPMLK